MDTIVPIQPTLARINPPGFSEAWQMVAAQLRMEMRRNDYETWIEALRPLGFNEGIFRLGAVNSYCIDWVESRLRSRIVKLLEGLYGQAIGLKFSLISPNAALPEDKPARVMAQPAAPAQETLIEEDAALVPPPVIEPPAAREQALAKKGSASKPANGVATNGKNGSKSVGEGAETVAEKASDSPASPRKIQLQRAYGTERARVVQPERGMFITNYLFTNWLPLLGHSAFAAILAARSLCYWNPMTNELRNVVETEMGELAKRANVSVRTIKDVLNNDLVKQYFLRYKVRRVMTSNGVRTAGIIIQVRMDDPLTPEDQLANSLPETEHWYGVDFEEEEEKD